MASTLPKDTSFKDQWHLHNTVKGEYDLNVVKVWGDYTGAGVKVFVFDNGFDYNNTDLSPNYDLTLDHDYGNNDDDAAPFYTDDDHGTAVMGIIGAARNGKGAVGVAYDASLIGFRIDLGVSADTFRAEIVSMLTDAVTKGGAVANMSFGGAGSFDTYDGAANVAAFQSAVADAESDGRGGLGLILVKAAGNDRDDNIQVNHNSEDSDSRQIIVAACDRNGYVSTYSSEGAPILISAFGSPPNGQIVTDDRVGADGYSDTDITTTFNGTSAATPMISGVVALMLQANADLGWRDVQSILAYSARHTGSTINGVSLSGAEHNLWGWNAATDWNGGGLHYSEDYGYGLVDALAAVRLAESWTAKSTSVNEKTASVDLLDASTTLPAADINGHAFTGTMNKAIDIERVTVDITMSIDFTPDLEVYITGPDGEEHKLISDQWINTDNQPGQNQFSGTMHLNSQAFRGADSKGEWSVRVVDDNNSSDFITVSDIVITAYGSAPTTNNTYVYTNEFSDYAGSGHSKTLKDANGGTDTLNASAVTAAMTVDLSKGTGKIDGVAIKISGIENVAGGDGADHLTGNGSANALSGGRGLDVLVGGKGKDSFVYHVVSDSLDGTKHDLIEDFSKGDRIDLSDIDTKAAAGDQGFNFIGGKALASRADLDFELTDKKGTADLTMIFADLDGDKHADFQIELSGLHHLVKGDFLL